jgi:transposase
MRKSIDGLSAIVSENFKLDSFDKHLFLFCGRKRDRIKAILWEGDGFLPLYKDWREAGSAGQKTRRRLWN